jgi:hypothetical protein
VWLIGQQRYKSEMDGESFYSRPRPTKDCSANNNNNNNNNKHLGCEIEIFTDSISRLRLLSMRQYSLVDRY